MFKPQNPGRWALLRKIASRHPGFREAVLADARVTLRHRGEREVLRSGLDAAIQILRLPGAMPSSRRSSTS